MLDAEAGVWGKAGSDMAEPQRGEGRGHGVLSHVMFMAAMCSVPAAR